MKPRVNEIDVGKLPAGDLLPEAHERLAAAQAELNSAAAKYGETAAPRDGVTMRQARAKLSAVEDELAELEDRATRERAVAENRQQDAARKKIATLCEKRESCAAEVDSLVEKLTATITQWVELDGQIHEAWPLRKNSIPVALGRSRILGLLRETEARVSAGTLSDSSPSLSDTMRTAAEIVKDDTRQLNGAL